MPTILCGLELASIFGLELRVSLILSGRCLGQLMIIQGGRSHCRQYNGFSKLRITFGIRISWYAVCFIIQTHINDNSILRDNAHQERINDSIKRGVSRKSAEHQIGKQFLHKTDMIILLRILLQPLPHLQRGHLKYPVKLNVELTSYHLAMHLFAFLL